MISATTTSFEWIRGIVDWYQRYDSTIMFIVQSLATCCALFWLLYRAWLTLWTPVPKLISILGVEVPDPPNVSLAGIKADAITIHWIRPEASRPVHKYLIQVNGVNVGDTQKQETAITITGLKPAHFYNVRVIAVGSNNFQAGSSVIRLRTYGRDGRPILENGRVPSNFSFEEPQAGALEDSSDESPAVRGHSAGIEAAALPESSSQSMKRETSGGPSGQRRNTGGRKHSPSSAAADQAAFAARKLKEPEESMQKLTEKFEAIRRETDEIGAQVAKDADDYKLQISELTKEKDEKRVALKEKEEATERLRKDINIAESRNRAAQTRKTQKEKTLRDKESAKTKVQDDIVRWRKEIEDMKIERETWKKEKEKLDSQKQLKTEELRSTIRQRQNSLNGLEEEIKVKGLQIKELEEARQHLPGAQDDDESRARDAAQRRRDIDWEGKEKDLTTQLSSQSFQLRSIRAELQHKQAIYATLQAHQANQPFMYHGNSSGIDFDPTGSQSKTKSRRSRNRKSRTNTISSPVAGYPITDSPFPNASAYNNLNNTTSPTFAPGPYFDHLNETAMVPLSEQMGMNESDIQALTAGAPLSPTATALLPSNIFADDDPPSPRTDSVFGPALSNAPAMSGYENDPQSPSSSSRSASLMSSPHSSAHNLARYGVSDREYGGENDKTSLKSPRADFGTIGSPSVPDQPTTHKGFSNITNMFAFPRQRGKTLQDGPALGTLKQGQSQSFPRSAEEPDSINNKRRISFSSTWNVPSFLSRSSTASDATAGNGPAPARNVGARKRRGFDIFNRSIDDPTLPSDRNPSSPRPLSIASSDLPRPSTDSAPFGWPVAEGLFNRSSPLNANWSINAPQTWSRNPSRRPSIQHGSTTALTTNGIVSEDDDFLPSETLTAQTSPPAAGVIGTRPISSHKQVTPKLNPAAPAFKGIFNFTSKIDKDQSKGKGKEKETSVTSDEPTRPATSLSVSRMSRDTPSVRTQNSVSESHESLSLERTSSNTPSELTTPSAASTKEKESSFRQLLRKGSSSKFSLSSIRGKDNGLFGSKKPSSATNSDRNTSGERDSSFDEYGEDQGPARSVDSVTSSPMIGGLVPSEWKNKETTPAGTPKEGRVTAGWNRLKFSKSKGREGSEDEGYD